MGPMDGPSAREIDKLAVLCLASYECIVEVRQLSCVGGWVDGARIRHPTGEDQGVGHFRCIWAQALGDESRSEDFQARPNSVSVAGAATATNVRSRVYVAG